MNYRDAKNSNAKTSNALLKRFEENWNVGGINV
jgi:hypothetical protein